VENRDGCDRTCVAPAFELHTSEGVLSPVVVLQHRGLLLCGLPLTSSEPGNAQRYETTKVQKKKYNNNNTVMQ
jgi:hypothetical protein